jgi:hypothetical protein
VLNTQNSTQFNTPTISISGISLANKLRVRTASQRAVLAVELLEGRLVIGQLTATQAAKLADTNVEYLRAARRATAPQRALLRRGYLTIQNLKAIPLTPEQLDEIVHRAGTDPLWSAIERALENGSAEHT